MDSERQPTGDQLAAAFARWAAAERASEAARSRVAERSMRQVSEGSATLTGLLVDLAERGTHVSLSVGSARFSGMVAGVGPDFCVLERAGAPALMVRTAAIDVLSEPAPSQVPASGARLPALELSLAAALGALAEERWPVRLHLIGGAEVAGDLVAAGEDVLGVRGEPPARRLVHVRLGAVAVCELR